MPLWLVGMMGAGKTAVGRTLARRLDVAFFDTDAEVAERAACSVSELWSALGEASFRDLEAEEVTRLAGMDGVVATGGGALMDQGSAATMRASGEVVWLRASPQRLAERVGAGGERPLLGDHSPLLRLRQILEEREAAYEAAAGLFVDTDDLSVHQVVDLLVETCRRR